MLYPIMDLTGAKKGTMISMAKDKNSVHMKEYVG